MEFSLKENVQVYLQ